jgi:hypothetical protein
MTVFRPCTCTVTTTGLPPHCHKHAPLPCLPHAPRFSRTSCPLLPSLASGSPPSLPPSLLFTSGCSQGACAMVTGAQLPCVHLKGCGHAALCQYSCPAACPRQRTWRWHCNCSPPTPLLPHLVSMSLPAWACGARLCCKGAVCFASMHRLRSNEVNCLP